VATTSSWGEQTKAGYLDNYPNKTSAQLAQEAADKAQATADKAMAAVTPKSSPASSTATTLSWGGQTNPGYLDNYIAAGQVNKGGKVSWANIETTADINKINVATLTPQAILAEAEKLDKDIDGKSSTGSSIVKEGVEKFVFGAEYAGTQGVKITEVSGITASIAHGKRITWTEGDILLKVNGTDYVTDINTHNFDYAMNTDSIWYKRKSKELIRYDALTMKYVNNMISDLNISTTSADFLQNGSISCLKLTQTVTALSQTFTLAGVISAANVSLYSHTFNYGVVIDALNIGCSRITQDWTNITAQLTRGTFFNVAANSLDTFDTAAEKVGIRIDKNKIKIGSVKVDTSKIKDQVKLVSRNFNKGDIAINQLLVEIRRNDALLAEGTLSISEVEANVERGEVYAMNVSSVLHM
jgi:hypothetical protein